MTFKQLPLIPPLQKAVEEAGYRTPSPIQAKAIPPVLAGHDLLGCAQTGTGKTAAFALPILQQLANRPATHNRIRALILTPTRELALQIGDSFAQYGKYLTLRHLVIFGGVGQQPQVDALKKGVDILIACPGRLNDLIGQGFVDLSRLEIFVLDEADRMLDMGFIHDVKKVLAKLPKKRQNLLFSATMPKEIEQLAASFLVEPVSVKVDPVSSTVDRIDQRLYLVEKADKRKLLPYLLEELDVKNALVFSRTKHGANRIAQDLTKAGITAAAIHGNKSQTARVEALEGFKSGKTWVLVATDIAARGIDINQLSHVFNFDLPEVPETYVHRIGRTARAGADGTAISFCCPEELEYLAGIEKLNRKKIPVVEHHPWAKGGAGPKAGPAPKPAPAKSPKATPQPAASQPAEPIKKEISTVELNQNPVPEKLQGLSASAKRRRRRKKAIQQMAEAAPAAPKAQVAREEPKPAQAKAAVQRPKAVPKAAGSKTPIPPKAANKPAPAQKAAPTPKAAAPKAVPQPKGAPAVKGAAPAKPAPAPKAAPQPRGKAPRAAKPAPDDPGLILITRKAPVQKFASFEAYMSAHGGETAPIVGWDEEEL